jgi:hypothetical protein
VVKSAVNGNMIALDSPSAVAARERGKGRDFRVAAADGSRFFAAHEPFIEEYLRPLVTGGEAYQPQ